MSNKSDDLELFQKLIENDFFNYDEYSDYDYDYGWDGGCEWLPPKITEPDEAKCEHEWEYYVGLNQQFYFCTKCDKKKDKNE